MSEEILWIGNRVNAWELRNEKRQLRTKKVYSCGVCGTMTNHWAIYTMWGFPSIHLDCPHRNDCANNTDINKKHEKLQALRDRLWDTNPLTRREIMEIKIEIKELLGYFKTLPGDVVEA